MGRNLKLLIIDDNPDLKDIYECGVFDAEIEVYNDGMQAIPLLEKNEFDAVLVDLAMPYMTGFSCVKEIRENEKLQFNREPNKIAFFTAYHVDEVVREAQREFNVERVFHKPIAPDELIKKIRNWLDDTERKILQ